MKLAFVLLSILLVSRAKAGAINAVAAYYLSPDQLAIHYDQYVQFLYSTLGPGIYASGCAVSLATNSSFASNVILLALSGCDTKPSSVVIANGTLLANYSEYTAAQTITSIEEIQPPSILSANCDSLLNASGIVVELDETGWVPDRVISLNCTRVGGFLPELFSSRAGVAFAFTEADDATGCSVSFAVNSTLVYSRAVLAAEFAPCGTRLVSPVRISQLNETAISIGYAAGIGIIDSAFLDPTALSVSCYSNHTSAYTSVGVEKAAFVQGDTCIEASLASPCISTDSAHPMIVEVRPGLFVTASFNAPVQTTSADVYLLSLPTISAHDCRDNVHYLTVSTDSAWKLSAVYENTGCIYEVGYTTDFIDVVITTPDNCAPVFEITSVPANVAINRSYTFVDDCPPSQRKTGFFDLALGIIITFFICLALLLYFIGLEIYWAFNSQPSFVFGYLKTVPDRVQRTLCPIGNSTGQSERERLNPISSSDDVIES